MRVNRDVVDDPIDGISSVLCRFVLFTIEYGRVGCAAVIQERNNDFVYYGGTELVQLYGFFWVMQ